MTTTELMQVHVMQSAAGQPVRGANRGSGAARCRAGRACRSAGGTRGGPRRGCAARAARARGREHGGGARHALHQAGVRRARRLLQGVQGAGAPCSNHRFSHPNPECAASASPSWSASGAAAPPRCPKCGRRPPHGLPLR